MSTKETAMKASTTDNVVAKYMALLGEVIPAIKSGQVKVLAAAENETTLRVLVSSNDRKTAPVAVCVGKAGAHALAIGKRSGKTAVDFYAFVEDPKELFTSLLWPGRASERAAKQDFEVLEVLLDREADPTKATVVVRATAKDFKKIHSRENIDLISQLTHCEVDVRKSAPTAARASTPIALPPEEEEVEPVRDTKAPSVADVPKAPTKVEAVAQPPAPVVSLPPPQPASQRPKLMLAQAPTSQPTPPPDVTPTTQAPGQNPLNPVDKVSVKTENSSIEVSVALVAEAASTNAAPSVPAPKPEDPADMRRKFEVGQDAEAAFAKELAKQAAGPDITSKPFGPLTVAPDASNLLFGNPEPGAPELVKSDTSPNGIPLVAEPSRIAKAKQKLRDAATKADEEPMSFGFPAGLGLAAVIAVLYFIFGGN
jgi:transcription antitermination factor NusA-like protein